MTYWSLGASRPATKAAAGSSGRPPLLQPESSTAPSTGTANILATDEENMLELPIRAGGSGANVSAANPRRISRSYGRER
jgi:hypothetical protein